MRNFVEHWSVTHQTQALFLRSRIASRLSAKRSDFNAIVWQLRRWLPLCKRLAKDEVRTDGALGWAGLGWAGLGWAGLGIALGAGLGLPLGWAGLGLGLPLGLGLGLPLGLGWAGLGIALGVGLGLDCTLGWAWGWAGLGSDQ
jgi:hypothetical protein